MSRAAAKNRPLADNRAIDTASLFLMSYAILFVCMGNICRSPSAHGVLRQRLGDAGLARRVQVDSAGTHNYHPGEPPDARSQRHAHARGYDLSDLRARQIRRADFERFDLIVAMDWDNLAQLEKIAAEPQRHKLRRLAEFFSRSTSPVVPDPYYGGPAGFEHVLDLIEDGCDGLIRHVRQLGLTRTAQSTISANSAT